MQTVLDTKTPLASSSTIKVGRSQDDVAGEDNSKDEEALVSCVVATVSVGVMVESTSEGAIELDSTQTVSDANEPYAFLANITV